MFISAFQTTPLKEYRIRDLVKELHKNRMVFPDSIPAAKYSRDLIYNPLLITPSLSTVAPFGHPLIVLDVDNAQQEYSEIAKPHLANPSSSAVYTDVRSFTRLNRDDSLTVSSSLDYNLALVRSSLSLYLVRNSPMDFLGLGNFPLTVYSRWITEQLTKRLALPPETQLKTTVLVAYFYLCQFEPDDVLDERTRLRMASAIARATFVNTEYVIDTISSVERLTDVRSLCAALVVHTDNIRFDNFNTALFYGILAGSWFGFNNRELTAVAIEHIPTFIAMLYFGVNDRGYRNTVISKIAKEYTKGDNDKVFLKGVDQLLFGR